MYSDRRSPGEQRLNANGTHPYETGTRPSENRRRNHTQRDIGENYLTKNRREYSSSSRQVGHDGTRDQIYYETHRQSYDKAQHRDEQHRTGELQTQSHPEKDREVDRLSRSRNVKLHLSGPSLIVQPRSSSSESLPPPPIPTSPSPKYLSIAAEPSESVTLQPRKLIILDLNGTLLYRPRPSSSVYPRPYMPAFRDFLLCPATRQWLDVMVWSSAQPYNVERMVRRCFFDPRLGPPPREREHDGGSSEETDERLKRKDKWEGKLLGVWARDTLGLSRRDYSRKSQTTKDLEKPWSALPGSHGTRTTVLLDDSPRKARLQPFNHVCINEYSAELRNWDVSVKRRTQRITEAAASFNDAEEVEGSKDENSVPTRNVTKREAGGEYDSTLLAVIGILDALKHESNVAGWIRAGGLWAGQRPPSLDLSAKEPSLHEEPAQRVPSPTDLEVNNDESVLRPVSPSIAKRQRSIGVNVREGVADMKRTKFNATDKDPEPSVAGNDAETIGTAHGLTSPSTKASLDDIANDVRTRMWFEGEETFRTWVSRGRAALQQLEIEERDGIYID